MRKPSLSKRFCWVSLVLVTVLAIASAPLPGQALGSLETTTLDPADAAPSQFTAPNRSSQAFADSQPRVLTAGLLQFQTGNHLAGFLPNKVYFAALDHALSVEFVDVVGVTPQANLSSNPSSTGKGAWGREALSRVSYPNLWPGITVIYDAAESGIAKTTYQIAPGADAAQIQLRYNLPAELQSDGSIKFTVVSSRGELTESAPVAWQEIDGRRVPVDVAFKTIEVSTASIVGFNVGAYDPRYPLVIDPVYAWHTFYGGSGADYATALAVDGSGNVYMAGHSDASWQGNGNANPLHPYSGSGHDMVIVKLSSTGNYQWHTFYGGTGTGWSDVATALAVDGGGNVVVAGYSGATWQGDGNTNPLHPHSSSSTDMVIMKLDSAGSYQWHTFYGGTSEDIAIAHALAVDDSGNVVVAGYSDATWQGDGNANPLHPYSGSPYDVVIVKLNSAGSYQWHTFYGGTSNDWANALAVDGGGNVIVAGASRATWSGDGNVNPLHPYSGSSDDDIVIVKLDSAGSYQWHTFYGGSGADSVAALAVDGNGNVIVAGYSDTTWQGDGNASPLHPYGGGSDIVIVKLSSTGNYQWHTFYGGTGTGWSDAATALAVDDSGNVYVAGHSPATWQGDGNTNPLHPNNGNDDMVIVKLSGTGSYQWHTFYGGTSYDYATALAMDGSKNVVVAGYSTATWQGDGSTNPLHPYSMSSDMVVMKLTQPPVAPDSVALTGPTTGTVDTAYVFTATVLPITATLPITYVWQASGQSPVSHSAVSRLTDTVTFTWPSGVSSTQTITVTASNAEPEVVTGTATINVLPLFSEVSAALIGVDWGSVAWGDYDNDGWLDILLTGNTGIYVAKVYHNNGNGTFTDIGAGLTGVYGSSVAWGDYDNDGWLDILLTGATGTTYIAKVYHNNGNGTFTDIGAELTGVGTSSVAWGDYDNDGWLDILLTGYTGSTAISKVYHNNGNGTFLDINAGLTGVGYSSVAWGDYDNDGWLDILLTGYTGSTTITKVYHNNGNGTFTDSGAGLMGARYSSVAWGDYDNDGRLDILLAGYTGATSAKVYHNNGDGTFTDIGAGLTGVLSSSVAWGDYDNDGQLDILLTGTTTGGNGVAKVYHNNGNGTFTDSGASLMGVCNSSVAWGDYDNDSDLDFLLTGDTDLSPTAIIYRNNTFTTNTAPSAPFGLLASQSGSTTTLSWNASSDGQTPPTGLSYNLRVSTTSGGSQIVVPMADTSTGYRRVPQLGNAQHGLTATLRNLAPGQTYYWSAQAIDTAWAGSLFAGEKTFSVPVPLANVVISGPTNGAINTTYIFAAAASPITATTPVTYTWTPTPNSGQGAVNATYSWATAGTQTITVTATNAGSTVTDTHTIVTHVPLDSVTLAGPTSGVINVGHTFTATVSPISATTPITYTWAPTPNSGQGMVNATYLWATDGVKAITVTATNLGGVVTATHLTMIRVPISSVLIDGPTTGAINATYAFTATTSPITATTPITYTWMPAPDSGQGTSIARYTWATTGIQVITVTATNEGGAVTDTQSITIDAQGPITTGVVLTSSHSINTWSPACTVVMTWTGFSDASGISSYIYLWDAAASTTITPGMTVSSTGNSTASQLLLTNGDHYFHVAALDIYGNWSGTVVTGPFKIDTVAPTGGSISINARVAYAASTSVTLTLSASDVTSGLSQMVFSNDGTTWFTQTYSTTANWTLSNGDGVKTVYARFVDNADNVSVSASDTITLDTAAPTGGSININAGALNANQTAVTLTLNALDAISGLSQMAFSNNGIIWITQTYGTSANWTLVSGEGVNTVYARFIDNAGNVGGNASDTIFLDLTMPLIVSPDLSVTFNPGGTLYHTSGTLTLYYTNTGIGSFRVAGLASDSASGLDRVSFSTAFGATPSDDTSPAVFGGDYDVYLGATESGLITATVFDKAGNSQAQTYTYQLDAAPPYTGNVNINAGAQSVTQTQVNVTLLSADAQSGMAEMCLSNNSSCTTWGTYATARSWALDGADGVKTVWVWFRDNLHNATGPFTDTIMLDQQAPTGGSVSLNGGATYAISTAVTLTLNATDVTSGPSQMVFSNDGITWITQTYSTTANWTLLSGDGPKTVYARFVDNAGNVGGNVTDTIILDTSAPTGGSININAGTAYAASTSVTLTLGASDATSGLSQMALSNDEATWFTQTYTTSANWTLVSGDGVKTVYARFMDNAGNVSENVSETITLAIGTPVPLDSVTLAGPTSGAINAGSVFTATVNPVTATTPITYVWQANDQLPVTHTNRLSTTDAITLTWNTIGTKFITVTAADSQSGAVTGTATINIAPASWTIMLYLNGDNNLDGEMERAFDELEAAMDHVPSNVKVLVLWDRIDAGNTRLYKVKYDARLGQTADYTEGVDMWLLNGQTELDMGDGQTLVGFVNWVRSHYSAQYYFLAIVDHGGGWSPELLSPTLRAHLHTGISWDDTTDNWDYLSTSETGTALAQSTLSGTNKIDVVFYDACLMGEIESAYEIKNYADYFVASQNEGWSAFAYDHYVSAITSTTTPRDLAAAIVREYHEELTPYFPHTLSAIDLRELGNVAAAVDQLGLALTNVITDQWQVISETSWFAQKFDSNWDLQLDASDGYVDLYDFARLLKQNMPDAAVQSASQQVMNALGSVGGTFVVTETHLSGQVPILGYQWNFSRARGLSIYAPLNEKEWLQIFYNEDHLRLGQDTHWDDFVRLYYHLLGWTDYNPPPPTVDPKTRPGPLQLSYRAYLPLVFKVNIQ